MRASLAAAAVAAALSGVSPAWAQAPDTQAHQGVPFRSMAPRAEGAAGQTNQTGPQIPLAGQPMSLEAGKTNATLNRMDGQVDRRLEGLRLGDGQMNPPDTTAFRSELQQMADEAREIRLLQLKQTRAELAMKLWSTVHDPRREEEAAQGAPRTAEGSQAAPVLSEAATRREADAKRAEAEAAEAQAKATMARQLEAPMPRVAQITGAGGNLRAILLVPYVGEVSANVGTPLPGGRRVARITSDGVYVSDPKLGTVPLGYGDSVPLTPPDLSASSGGTSGGPFLMAPRPITLPTR